MLKPLPAVGDFETRKQWEAAAWENLVKQLSLHSATEIKKILELVMSPYERHTIVVRAAGLTRIMYGKSYGEIGKELWLAPQTISSLKKSLASDGYTSNWPKAKEQALARAIKKSRQKERPWPASYKQTKYGDVRKH